VISANVVKIRLILKFRHLGLRTRHSWQCSFARINQFRGNSMVDFAHFLLLLFSMYLLVQGVVFNLPIEISVDQSKRNMADRQGAGDENETPH